MNHYSVKYSNMTAILVEAFKEQAQEIKKNRDLYETMHFGIEKQIEDNTQRIKQLESENTHLRERIREIEEKLERLLNKN